MSALSFPQFTHILSNIFFTFTMKPLKKMVKQGMPEQTQSHTGMKDWSCQFNMPKMARTLRHAFSTRLTFKVAVYGTHTGIHQSAHLRLMCGFVHDFWMFDFGDRDSFLWYCQFSVLNFFTKHVQFPQERGYQTVPL